MIKEIIVLDTNFVHFNKLDDLKRIFNTNIFELQKFINEHKIKDIEIFIPEVVIEERIFQRKIQVDEIVNQLKNSSRLLTQLEIKTDLEQAECLDYVELIKKEISQYLEKNSLNTLPLPEVEMKEIYDRALNKNAPFTRDTGGFKDTLIWLSIKKYLENKKNHQILFISDNKKDFQEDKLNAELTNNNKILVLENLPKLKEYFDSKLDLKLELKKYNNEIRNKVSSHLGELLEYVHKNQFRNFSGQNILFFKYDRLNIVGAYKISLTINSIIVELKLNAYISDEIPQDSGWIANRNYESYTHSIAERYIKPAFSIYETGILESVENVTIEMELEYDEITDTIKIIRAKKLFNNLFI